MDDQLDPGYYYGDGIEDWVSTHFPYLEPEELCLSSWDRVLATNDDWIDTWEYIQSIKGVRP